MRRRLIVVLLGLVCSSGFALNNRSAVSVTGSDAATCTVPDPCRTFGVAIAASNPGAEILALDSGGYGAFTANKPVTIIAIPGIYAGIAPTTGTAITISAGSSDIVVLRGLTLNSLGANLGIDITAAGKVHVENCIFNGFGVRGLRDQSAGELYVNDSIFRNGGSGSKGVEIFAASGTMRASIDRCRFEGNAVGIDVGGNGQAIVRDSVSVFNSLDGFSAQPFFTTSELNLENCVAHGNDVGIIAGGFSGGSGTVRVSNTMITNNNTGLVGTPMISFGNNKLAANTTAGSFSSTIPQQ